VPSIDERSLRPVHAPLAQHDPGPRQEPDAVSPRFCGPSRAPEGERAGAAKARPGALRRGPCAAHRLLQSTQSASTTAGPPEPRSAPWEVALFCAVPRLGGIETPPTPEVRLRAHLAPDVRSRARLDDATGWRRASARDEPCGPLSLQNGSSRGFTGQGPDGFRHPAPLAAIPRGESFAPTRSARTPRVVSSWRRRLEKPTTPGAGARAGSTGHRSGYEPTSRARFRDARHDPQATRSRGAAGPGKTAHAAFPPARMGGRFRGHHPGPRAASPDPPRRGPRSAAPEVPSIHGLPRPGQDVLHSLSPTCGKPLAPL
jgi:hypothetical protein